MSAAERFFDTNVLLYLLSGDEAKANRAETELSAGGILSVQVLNEFAAVATHRLKMSIAEIREVLVAVRAVCKVVAVGEETHDLGLRIAQRHRLSVYDSMVIASALLARCKVLLSEDLQHGQVFEGALKIRNPFR